MVGCTAYADDQGMIFIQDRCYNCSYNYTYYNVTNNITTYYNITNNITVYYNITYNITNNITNNITIRLNFSNDTINRLAIDGDTIRFIGSDCISIYQNALDFTFNMTCAFTDTNTWNTTIEMQRALVANLTDLNLSKVNRGENISCSLINGSISDLCTIIDTNTVNTTADVINAVNESALNGSNFFNIWHNSLSGLQGGNPAIDQFYHLSLTVYNAVVGNYTKWITRDTDSIDFIQTYLGQDAADGNSRQTWDYHELGTMPSQIAPSKIFVFDFNKPNVDYTYGRWTIDWVCINYGGEPPEETRLAEIAIGFPARIMNSSIAATTLLGNYTLKGDVSMKFRYQTGTGYAQCEDYSAGTATGGGYLGNVTIGIGNNSRTYDFRTSTAAYNWTTVILKNVSIESQQSRDNQIKPYVWIWAVVRQNTDISDCPGIGIEYQSCLDIESMSIEQYKVVK